MPPKKKGAAKKAVPQKGTKRKATDAIDGESAPKASDRKTWTGWVEMESEPAFFNVMLKEMGVSGLRINEVIGLDDDDLSMLPQPVHALIFCFQFTGAQDNDEDSQTGCPKEIWFANQVPEFSCASVALLNIINNIHGLETGKEMRDFRKLTCQMDPINRGYAIDEFDFLKRIHNSFARDIDILNADLHHQEKFERAQKREARALTEAKKAAPKKPAVEQQAPARNSGRKPPPSKKVSARHARETSSDDLSPPPASDSDYESAAPNSRRATTPAPTSPTPRRRPTREPKPRTSTTKTTTTTPTPDLSENGFHFIAYMPIGTTIYQLDGLEPHPNPIAHIPDPNASDSPTPDPFSSTPPWLAAVKPALQARMQASAAQSIAFNLMAVGHDAAFGAREALASNLAALGRVEGKLDGVFEDWREMEGGETGSDVVVAGGGGSGEFGVSAGDVAAAEVGAEWVGRVEGEGDFLVLMEVRREVLGRQAGLRKVLREAGREERADAAKALHRRHDYPAFVRGWLEALAEQEVLADLLE